MKTILQILFLVSIIILLIVVNLLFEKNNGEPKVTKSEFELLKISEAEKANENALLAMSGLKPVATDNISDILKSRCLDDYNNTNYSIQERKNKAEEAGVYGNNTYIRDYFYSSFLDTCVADMEIVNRYQKPTQYRRYAEDITNNIDLFSTNTYNEGDQNYVIESKSYYNKLNQLK